MLKSQFLFGVSAIATATIAGFSSVSARAIAAQSQAEANGSCTQLQNKELGKHAANPNSGTQKGSALTSTTGVLVAQAVTAPSTGVRLRPLPKPGQSTWTNPNPLVCPTPQPAPVNNPDPEGLPDPREADKGPAKLMIVNDRAYKTTVQLLDTGNHSNDGDSVKLDTWKRQLLPQIFPTSSVTSAIGSTVAKPPLTLPSVESKVCASGWSQGTKPPTTVSYFFENVEQKTVPLGSDKPVSKGNSERFIGNLTFLASQCAELDCRKAPTSSGTPSAQLGRNLELGWYKERLPCGTQAHHIIPAGANYTSAQQSRTIYTLCEVGKAFGIPKKDWINNAKNGVPLPESTAVPVSGYVHSGRHSNAYMDAVYSRLRAASGLNGVAGETCSSNQKLAVESELERIRIDLESKSPNIPPP
jgi:hypothetical protein